MDTQALHDPTEAPGPHTAGHDASRAAQPQLCHPRTQHPPPVDHSRNRSPIANSRRRLQRSTDPANTDNMFIRDGLPSDRLSQSQSGRYGHRLTAYAANERASMFIRYFRALSNHC